MSSGDSPRVYNNKDEIWMVISPTKDGIKLFSIYHKKDDAQDRLAELSEVNPTNVFFLRRADVL